MPPGSPHHHHIHTHKHTHTLLPTLSLPPPAEPPLTRSTEYIFYAGVALFLLRAWAFGFGKANREKLGLIMLYSLASMLLTAEVRPSCSRTATAPLLPWPQPRAGSGGGGGA